MKNLIKINGLIFLVILLFSLVSCDKIDAPYTYPPKPIIDDSIKLCGVSNTDTISRVVLLEDYTGHTCTNCPKAHDTTAALLHKYPKNLVAIAVHAGSKSIPEPNNPNFTYDFRVPAASITWYENTWAGMGVQGTPWALINRTKYGSTMGVTGLALSQWGSKVEEIIHNAPDAIVKIHNYKNKTIDNKYTTKVETTFKTPLNGGTYKLIVCLIEDSIVKPQLDSRVPGGLILNYVHMHVLRDVLFSDWGELVADGDEGIDNPITLAYTFQFKEGTDWKAEHMSVVGFVYDVSDYHILQVSKAPLDTTKAY